MIEIRQAFLKSLFASLEANGVRYCLLRNYDDLYTATDTDVDLLVSEYSRERFELCLRRSAAQTGFRFVHAARYVNYSHVFWHPQAGFIRIDFETDVRWRLFTVLTARDLLDRRQRYEDFFVPHPEDESVVLFVAVIWRGELSDRYRRQLARLYQRCSDPDSLKQTLARSFGRIGPALADFQAAAHTAGFDRKFSTRVRMSLVFHSHLRWWRLKTLTLNTLSDVGRIAERLKRPAGVSLLFISAQDHLRGFEDLKQRINFLFPLKKNLVRSFDLSAQPAAVARWKFELRWSRLRTIFKGGMFVRAYQVATNADLPRLLRTHARYLYPNRTFVCGEDRAGVLYFAHIGSGFMISSQPGARLSDQAFSEMFITFIAAVLERRTDQTRRKRKRRGVFAVLCGLDGSGKTTLARNLCDVTSVGSHFNGVRYFHFRPKLFRHVELPLPEFKNQPRKPPPVRGSLNTILSIARLTRNILLVRLAWLVHVRPKLKRGYLVLVDRYFYNYHLDPASVKYAGPKWLLDWAQNWFPQPEAALVLRTPASLLLQRKQELSPQEIARQMDVLEQLRFGQARVLPLDASLPATEVAQQALASLAKAPTDR